MENLISKELLGLVLDEGLIVQEVYQPQNIETIAFKYTELGFKYENTNMFNSCGINLDTLTRLCKEWLISKNYTIALFSAISKKQWLIAINEHQFFADTELEAVIKATEWVAKEKGLIK